MEFLTPAHPLNAKAAVRLVKTISVLNLDSEFFIELPDVCWFAWHICLRLQETTATKNRELILLHLQPNRTPAEQQSRALADILFPIQNSVVVSVLEPA